MKLSMKMSLKRAKKATARGPVVAASLFGNVDDDTAAGEKKRKLVKLDYTEEERLALMPKSAASAAQKVRRWCSQSCPGVCVVSLWLVCCCCRLELGWGEPCSPFNVCRVCVFVDVLLCGWLRGFVFVSTGGTSSSTAGSRGGHSCDT